MTDEYDLDLRVLFAGQPMPGQIIPGAASVTPKATPGNAFRLRSSLGMNAQPKRAPTDHEEWLDWFARGMK